MSEDCDIKTTITVPSDLLWKFREEAPRRRMTFKGAVAQAFERWLYGALPAAHSTDTSKEPLPLGHSGEYAAIQSQIPASGKSGAEPWGKYQRAHEDLDYILDRGPGGMPDDILGNIGWFALAAKVANGDAPPSALSDARRGEAKTLSKRAERSQATVERYIGDRSKPEGTQGREKPPEKQSG